MSAFSLVLQYGLAIIGIIRSALGDATISTPYFYDTILSPFPQALNVPLSVTVGFTLNAGKRSLQAVCAYIVLNASMIIYIGSCIWFGGDLEEGDTVTLLLPRFHTRVGNLVPEDVHILPSLKWRGEWTEGALGLHCMPCCTKSLVF